MKTLKETKIGFCSEGKKISQLIKKTIVTYSLAIQNLESFSKFVRQVSLNLTFFIKSFTPENIPGYPGCIYPGCIYPWIHIHKIGSDADLC